MSESSLHSYRQSSTFYHHKGATSAQPSSVDEIVKEIIHVFVDALPHIPDHRRLPFFTHLLATVGIEEYLHVALGLLVEKRVVQASLDQQVCVITVGFISGFCSKECKCVVSE